MVLKWRWFSWLNELLVTLNKFWLQTTSLLYLYKYLGGCIIGIIIIIFYIFILLYIIILFRLKKYKHSIW